MPSPIVEEVHRERRALVFEARKSPYSMGSPMFR